MAQNAAKLIEDFHTVTGGAASSPASVADQTAGSLAQDRVWIIQRAAADDPLARIAGDQNQHTSPDMADGNLFVGDKVIESPPANGEHLFRLVPADQETLIWSDRYGAWTLALGDVYYGH